MTKESAVSKCGSSNLLEEISKLKVELIMDELILTSKENHWREEFLLSGSYGSPRTHCQYSQECSRGYVFF